MDLVINLIGIITLSCGDQVFGRPDPCVADFPKPIAVVIPDGRFNPTVCKEGNTVDPMIRPHEAFIRVRGAAASAAPQWPRAIACSDMSAGPPCVLYPLRRHELTISHVTSGAGVSELKNLNLFPEIRWREQMPDLSLGSQMRIGFMIVRNGEITYDLVPHSRGMVGATIRVKNVTGNITIRASNASGARELVVPASASIDIINLPRSIALSDFSNLGHAHSDMDCDHFFLHYLLATDRPERDCHAPQNEECLMTRNPAN